MFEFNTWVRNYLISGVKRGAFSREWAAVKIADYICKGKMTADDAAAFDTATAEPDPTAETEITDISEENEITE